MLHRLLMLCVLVGGPGYPNSVSAQLAELAPPKTAFDKTRPPPAPDYAQRSAWAAWPGVKNAADTVPNGAEPEAATSAKADVFFIHPTTYLANDTWNAKYNEGDFTGRQLDEIVLSYQASAFNACCRIYAPRYRQVTISGFLNPSRDSFKAYDLAYSDVLRAFDNYIAHENKGRPIILASHSQGSLHATRLIQERLRGDAKLRSRLVAVYLVGASLPEAFDIGVPVCKSASDTGCLVGWNSTSAFTPLALGRGLMVTWHDGKYQSVGLKRWLCVNPLSWDRETKSPASANKGSLPFAGLGKTVPALRSDVTGARCTRGRLAVSVARAKRDGFIDKLTKLGSYHNLDYGLFYDSIRRNAVDRVNAFQLRPGQ